MKPNEFIMKFSNYSILNIEPERTGRLDPPNLEASQLERDVLVNLIGYF